MKGRMKCGIVSVPTEIAVDQIITHNVMAMRMAEHDKLMPWDEKNSSLEVAIDNVNFMCELIDEFECEDENAQ